MDWRTSLQCLGILAFLLASPAQISGSTVLELPQANTEQQVGIIFLPTEDKGLPRERGATAGMPRCLAQPLESPSLIALVPPNSVVKTVTANPTLYIYVSKLREPQAAELMVIDEADREIYKRTFTIPGTAGIHKLTISESLPLARDTNYRWYFSVICDPQDRASDLFVEGVLRRTELSRKFKALLQQAENPLEQARFYAGARIWNETLNIAVQLRREHSKEWEELFKSVKLEKYSQKPFVECCTVK